MIRCTLCHDQVKRDDADIRLAFEFTPEQLQRSAFDRGCESCLVILEGLRQSEGKDWKWRRDIRIVYALCHSKRGAFQDTLLLQIYFLDDRPKLELEYYSLQPHAWRSILPRTSISGHPLSSQALTWTKSLLDKCESQHVSCRRSARPLLPKRVILLNSEESGKVTARLFEPINQRSPYIALSHCWGNHQNCITTKKSVSARKAGIPWKQIPQTFRDVMQLALKLGFRFIWIDSLCIVQDDAEDWEVQSALMSEIYQNAVLTLAATSSNGDNEGCCQRNANRVRALEITLPDDVGACRIAVRRPLNHFDAQTGDSLIDHFPLLTRGWAFQERLLSPRVLHVCESELAWECREASVCECGGLAQERSPGGTYHHAVEDTQEEKEQHELTHQDQDARLEAMRLERAENARLVAALAPRHDDVPGYDDDAPPSYADVVSPAETEISTSSDTVFGPRSSDEDIFTFAALNNVPMYEEIMHNQQPVSEVDMKDCPDLVFHFHRIVEQYSALNLTRPSDRLVALSGLCKRVQHLRNNYLAGLWSDSIGYDLLWRVETINLNTESNGARSLDYRGPTWSWISVDSSVHYWPDIINFRETHQSLRTHPAERATLFRSASGFGSSNYIPAGRHPSTISMAVTCPGQNPFGTVTSAILTLTGSSTTGTLRYTPSTSPEPVRYRLELNIPSPVPVELPIDADYALNAPGESHVPPDSELVLLLIHPEVCLVLREARRGCAPTSVNGERAWERVGHARVPGVWVRLYGIDWMGGSEVRGFCIV